jgi:hypothetical protein
LVFTALPFPKVTKTLTYSFVGFEPFEVSFNLVSDTAINIELELNAEIQEITVYGEAARKVHNTEMSMVELPVIQVQKIPLLWENLIYLKCCSCFRGKIRNRRHKWYLRSRWRPPTKNLFLLDGGTCV